MTTRSKPVTEEEAARGAEIVAWMDRHGWSVARLAERTGITTTTLYRYRTGELAVPLVARRAFDWANDHTSRKAREGPAKRRGDSE